MLGTAGKDDSPFGQRIAGNDAVYVVRDHPDTLLERAATAGAKSCVAWPTRTTASADSCSGPEGKLWSSGTYAGE